MISSQEALMTVSLDQLLKDFAKDESFTAINLLPASHETVKNLLRATLEGKSILIQPLYARIHMSAIPELRKLTLHPHTLLSILLAISIAHGDTLVLTKLLSIDPSPRPDLKRFLSQPGTIFSAQITACQSPEIRSLMIRNGYQKPDGYGIPFDQALYDFILSKEEGCIQIVTTLLENRSQPSMAHLRVAMKFKPISVFELLLKHYPSEDLKDCRLLHDAIEEGKAGRVLYLLDVVGINIDMFPTERSEQGSDFSHTYRGKFREPNGTPLHQAVRHSRKGIVKLLLNKGARVDIVDEYGLTPYEVARKGKAHDILACFPVNAKLATKGLDIQGFLGILKG